MIQHLYVLFGVATRRCKIGVSRDVHGRFRDIQAMSADDLVLWCWAEGYGTHEGTLHLFFEQHRLHGEWFSPQVTEFFANRVPSREAHSSQLAALLDEIDDAFWGGAVVRRDGTVLRGTALDEPCRRCGSALGYVEAIGDRDLAMRCRGCHRTVEFPPAGARNWRWA